MAQLVEYRAEITALDGVAANAAQTSAAIEVVQDEFVRVAINYALGASTSVAATDKIKFYVLGSQDGGTTYRKVMKIASDDTISLFEPFYALDAGDITAKAASFDAGAVHVVGLTHIKIVAQGVDVAGTVGAGDKITVKVRSCRE